MLINKNRPKRWLRHAREKRNLSLETVSAESGIALETLYQYEYNKTSISTDHFEQLYPILHLEQFYIHKVTKNTTPSNAFNCLTMHLFHDANPQSFTLWLRIGFSKIINYVANNRTFKQVFGLLLIISFLGALTDQLAIETLFISALVPVALSLFMIRYTVEQDLTGWDVVKLFIYGGLTGMLLVYLIRDITGFYGGISGDFLTGFIEETAKIVIVFFALRKFRVQTVKGGMLIGFLIGAGFDAFETADYAIWTFMETFDYDETYTTMFARSFFAIFGIGHHYWTAILAGTLVYVKQNDLPKVKDFFKGTFIQMFILIVVIHALWNFTIESDTFLFVLIIILSTVIFLKFLQHATLEEKHNQHTIHINRD